ncbi:MAG: hypothetical protein HN350_20520, partial [Phycisphaerales bacterium]|nr:hypothetical protein [Phycisphaerales bacterium]
MTFDELELLVATADRAGLVKAVRGMPESERKKLSKATAKLHRDMQNSKWEPPKAAKNNGLLTRLTLGIRERQRRIQDQFTVARLATLAFCSLSTVRNVHAGYNGSEDMKAMMDILADRRPEWINEWLNAKIGSEWSEINWDTTRALVTSGLCDRPTSGGYIGLMIRGLPDPSYAKEGRRHTPLSRKLLKAPDLLDDEVWRLFEIETYAFFNLHSYERSPHAVEGFENWGQALCRLADEGHLDRGRLMDSSLSGLTMGFSNNMLTGYIAFHDRLKPSIDELTERQQTYIDLLPCSASRVVTFALKMLKALDKAKLLDDAAFLATSQCLLNIPTKTQPKTGLMLLKHIVKRNADMAPLAARAAATGLTHPSPDIQERALELLELAAVEDDEKLHAIIANCLEDLAAVHRPRAEQLLSKLGDMSPSEQLDAVTPKTDLMRTELIQRCEA